METQFKFFIIEDDIFSANLYKQFLAGMNHNNVTCYNNSEDCFCNLALKPDVIFLDYTIENTNEFEVLKKIKQFNPNIYVVMVLGQENINTASDALKYGAFDYIVKDNAVCYKMATIINKIIKVKAELKKSNPNFIQRVL
jgi:DNA-binding NtrC family response regulator